MKLAKKEFLLLGFILATCLGLGWAAENRKVQWEPVSTFGWESDLGNVVRFTTTTTTASRATCLVSTHTAFTFVVPSGVGDATTAPVQTSSTTNTYGGRQYMTFQIVATAAATDRVAVDFSTNTLSATTSPWLTVGQWWSPDQPIAWQGPVCLISASTFTVTGWYWTPRGR